MRPEGGPPPDLTIIIPTRHRHGSLLETLRALDPATMPPRSEVVVVDNAPKRELDPGELAEIGAGRLRLLHEPKPGKWRCLNTAIRDGAGGGLGEVVAVLDDDMAPMPGWAQGVIESARSRPAYDLFAGKSHVVWPAGASVPAWAHHFLAQGVCFSVLTWDGDHEREMGARSPTPAATTSGSDDRSWRPFPRSHRDGPARPSGAWRPAPAAIAACCCRTSPAATACNRG